MKEPGFYVSVVDGDRKALVAGPFKTHEEALAAVPVEREAWYAKDPWTHFYGWGTACVKADRTG